MTIEKVHNDDPGGEPYFTVRRDDGSEAQTVQRKLSRPQEAGAPPTLGDATSGVQFSHGTQRPAGGSNDGPQPHDEDEFGYFDPPASESKSASSANGGGGGAVIR